MKREIEEMAKIYYAVMVGMINPRDPNNIVWRSDDNCSSMVHAVEVAKEIKGKIFVMIERREIVWRNKELVKWMGDD